MIQPKEKDGSKAMLTTENLDDTYFCFLLGEEDYAVGIRQVVQIVGLERVNQKAIMILDAAVLTSDCELVLDDAGATSKDHGRCG
ncbi:hypothetical protein ACSBLW_11395 [Thioclava sp. FR2]|uniref:hypothetical protein n=1 Tax=Thioclava sp. FR2 TaxID=3445780 RepID=UPI003EBBFA74